jgi:hypothetical protein
METFRKIRGIKLKKYCNPEFKGECQDRKNNGVCGWEGQKKQTHGSLKRAEKIQLFFY